MINWKIERRKIYRFASFQNYCNWQTTPRFPLKAETKNSQREPLRVKGLRSNKNNISEKLWLIFQHPQKCIQPSQNVKAGYSPESSMRRKNSRAPAVKVCLPMREKRQRDYLIFCLFDFDLGFWCDNATKPTRYQGIVPVQFLSFYRSVSKNA